MHVKHTKSSRHTIGLYKDCWSSSSDGSMLGQQWALSPPQFNCLPSPKCISPIFFAQALLPMYNVANGVYCLKRLGITVKIMNYKQISVNEGH